MKKSLLFALLTLAVSCVQLPQFRTGDLVFVAIPDESSSDGELTYVHAAMLDVDQTGTWIVDATFKHGVDRHPLDTFIADFRRHDGSYPLFEVVRLADDTDAASFVKNAKRFIGEPYDIEFDPDNGRHYCTELIYDSYVRGAEHVFDAEPMTFKNGDGVYPSYWPRIIGRIGAEIPEGKIGTTPRQMRFSDAVTYVGNIQN